MQAGHQRDRHDAPQGRWVDGAGKRAVVVQSLVWAHGVVRDVSVQQATEMSLIEHDEVVEAFSADGADEALGEGILPWGMRGDEELAGPRPGDSTSERGAIGRVSIAE